MLPKIIKSNIPIIAAICVGIAGANASAMMPAIIATLTSKGNMLQSESGLIAALELFGTGICLMAIAPFIDRFSASKLALFGAIFFLIINIMSIQTESYYGLCVLRFLGGIASGLLYGIMSKILGTSDNPERMFGLFFVGHISVGFCGLQLWSWLDSTFPATQGPYIWLSFLSFVAIFASLWITNDNTNTKEMKNTTSTISIPLCAIALLAMFLFNAGVMGIWSYVIGIGNAKGINTSDVLLFMSFGSLAGLAGALASTWMGSRLGNILPIILTGGCFLLIMAILASSKTEMVFGVSLLFFMIFWVFLNPYVLGIFSKLDSQGRLVTLSVAALYGGLAAGPAIMGVVIDSPYGGYTYMIYLSMALFLLSIFLIVYAFVANEKRTPPP